MERKNIKMSPQFKNEEEEAQFWLEHDFTDYYDPAKRVKPNFPNLKPSTQSITVRLPKPLVRLLKLLANEQDIPYQSLLKRFLYAKVKATLALKQHAGDD